MRKKRTHSCRSVKRIRPRSLTDIEKKEEIIACSPSCNIDVVMFTHQPSFPPDSNQADKTNPQVCWFRHAIDQNMNSGDPSAFWMTLYCYKNLCGPHTCLWPDIEPVLCFFFFLPLAPRYLYTGLPGFSSYFVFAVAVNWSSCLLLKQGYYSRAATWQQGWRRMIPWYLGWGYDSIWSKFWAWSGVVLSFSPFVKEALSLVPDLFKKNKKCF